VKVRDHSRFDLVPVAQTFRFGDKNCIGGGAVGGYSLSNNWQWSAEVGGCGFRHLPKNWNGDSLTFMTGPQWVQTTRHRFKGHLHLRFGGQKITTQFIDAKVKKIVDSLPPLGPTDNPNIRYDLYAKDYSTTGPALSLGGGLDVRLTGAIGLHPANVEYVHSWLRRLNGTSFNEGFRVSSGIVLRIGTW
jgi:hypothetical protein